MMSCKIICNVFHEGVRDWEITSDGRLWPCCYYANSYQDGTLDDEIILSEFQKDPDWNDLTKNSVDKVVENTVFSEYIFIPGWQSDNPPAICKRECSAVIDHDGREQSGARIQLKNDD